ncbi:hypothetical protein CTAYLR_003287 [Chrysophaeum taylorii]|uniref:Pirin n=1 Tax=Chrysophaeum taylorii TaxID=2483200 RepID=A0AAD7UAB0_9STRA|nr:hypothetical protein CTAYLR_003287 [Chrysophaeum taylorii]
MDPFLMVGYHDDWLPPARELKEAPGFPQHPHAGFETITITIDAMVDHADSLGGSGRYGNGDTQFMCAGRGISHSEMAGLQSWESGNGGALFQLWLSLPSKAKRCAPATRMLWHEDVPIKVSDGVEIKTIVGPGQAASLPPDSWAADPANNVQILIVTLAPGARCVLDRLSTDASTLAAYPFEGALACGGVLVPERHAAVVTGAPDLENRGDAPARVLILEANPINEPVVARGPFVANSRSELMKMSDDYRAGRFAAWPWPSEGPSHGTKPRFYDDPTTQTHEERGDPITLYAPGPPSYLPSLLGRLARRRRDEY